RGHPSEPTFLDRLAADPRADFPLPQPAPDLLDYVEIAIRGGFPEALAGSAAEERTLWLEGYLDQILTQDAALVSGRDPARMRRYFDALALSSAGLAAQATINDAAGINRKTADAYERLLVNLMILDLVPAWLTSRLARLVKSPKRYLVDPSLMATALRVDGAAVLRDGDLMGRLLETMVVAQLRPELALSPARPRLHHLRQADGRHKVDLLVEMGGDRLVALEVKATAAPGPGDARHLAWLRDTLGDRFVAGAVLHTGPGQFTLGARLTALPIASIWGP
ncbi:MAG: ATP-binding protein, partial [Candidatus Dormibacteria bacterium]